MLLRYFYILFVLRLNMCISSAALRKKNITWYLFFNAKKKRIVFCVFEYFIYIYGVESSIYFTKQLLSYL